MHADGTEVGQVAHIDTMAAAIDLAVMSRVQHAQCCFTLFVLEEPTTENEKTYR